MTPYQPPPDWRTLLETLAIFGMGIGLIQVLAWLCE